MNPARLPKFYWLVLLLPFVSCDKARVLDENKDLNKHNWYFKDRLAFEVSVEDTNKTYNVYVNLRIGNDYKYSNFFVMIHQISPSHQIQKERKEITLLDDSGKWLGKGLGDIYDYQQLVYPQMRFKEKGIYRFELEQNMRDDTLAFIYSAGLRVEDFELSKK